MADFDLGAVIGGLVQNVGSYFMTNMAQKQQMKMAQQMVGYQPRLPTLGMGYGAAPVTAYGYGAQGPGPMALPSQPPGSVSPLGSLGQYLGLSDTTTGGNPCSLFVQPQMAPRPRAQQLVMQQNPVTGRMHFWRHVGHPILYSGDVSHCRTVNRILGRASRKAGRRRPR